MERDIEIGLTKLRLDISQFNQKQREEEAQYENADGDYIDVEPNKQEEDMTRQIFHPFENTFDYGNRRVTDLPECAEVKLPKPVDQKYESEMAVIREIILKEFKLYKKQLEDEMKENWKDIDNNEKLKERLKRNQEYRNLTKSEKRGLFKLKKRIKKGDIMVVKTDKSGKLVLMKKEDYLKIGIKDNERDKRLNRKDIKDIQKMMNDHTKMQGL